MRARKRAFVGTGLGLLAILIVNILEFYFSGVFPLYPWASLPSASPPSFWPIITPIVVLAMVLVMGDLVDLIIGIGPPQLKRGGVDFEVDKDRIRSIEVSRGRNWVYRLLIELKSGKSVEFRMYHGLLGKMGSTWHLLEVVAKFSEGQPMKQYEDTVIWTFKS